MPAEESSRSFRRYSSSAECELQAGTETYKGRILNYSDGAGLIVEKKSHLVPGTSVYIRVLDHEMEFEGEVAWAEEEGDNIRAGIRRTGSFKGSLADFRAADILMGLNRTGRTGELQVTSGPAVKMVYFREGDMVFASSNDENEQLGKYLLKKMQITLPDFKKSSEIQSKTGQKLGKVLVDLDCIPPRELFQAVRNQAEEIIINLFSIENGRFEFKEGPQSDETITLQISAASIIYNGIKSLTNLQLVKKVCPPEDEILYLSHDRERVFQSSDFSEDDKKVLSRINGEVTLKELTVLSPLKEIETLKTIAAFICTGHIQVKTEDLHRGQIQQDEPDREPEEGVQEPVTLQGEMPGGASHAVLPEYIRPEAEADETAGLAEESEIAAQADGFEEIEAAESAAGQNRASGGISAEDVHSPEPAAVAQHSTAERTRIKKSRIYLPVVMIVILFLGVSIPVIDDDIEMYRNRHRSIAAENLALPDFRITAFSEALSGADGSTGHFASYRDEAFMKAFGE